MSDAVPSRWPGRGGLRLAPLLLVLALAACSWLPARVDPPAPFPVEERIIALDTVWQQVHERFYDARFNGVDWGTIRGRYRHEIEAASTVEATYRILQRMTGELRDSHTRVSDARQALDRRREEAISIGIGVRRLENTWIVTTVEPEAGNSIAPGDRLTEVDGVPVEESYARFRAETGETVTERANRMRWLRDWSSGPIGSKVQLTLERDGVPLRVELTRRLVSTSLTVSARRLDDRVGYLRFNRFRAPLAQRIRDELGGLPGIAALVIDLRGNSGGALGEMRAALEVFTAERIRITHSFTRTSSPSATARTSDFTRPDPGRAPAFTGRIAVLVSDRTASAAEIFASAMQEQFDAVVVGVATCGCVVGVRQYKPLPGGGEVAVSEIGFISPRGNRLEGRGVEPDVVVVPGLPDIRARRDVVLDAAVRALGASNASDRDGGLGLRETPEWTRAISALAR